MGLSERSRRPFFGEGDSAVVGGFEEALGLEEAQDAAERRKIDLRGGGDLFERALAIDEISDARTRQGAETGGDEGMLAEDLQCANLGKGRGVSGDALLMCRRDGFCFHVLMHLRTAHRNVHSFAL